MSQATNKSNKSSKKHHGKNTNNVNKEFNINDTNNSNVNDLNRINSNLNINQINGDKYDSPGSKIGLNSQKGGDDKETTVVPKFVRSRTARNTPFITNVAKQVYSKKKNEEQQSDKSAGNQKFTKNYSNAPNLAFNQTTNTMQPSLKLEVFAPKEEPRQPYGIYNPMIPTINLAGKRFSADSYPLLFSPTSAVSWGPNVKMPVQQVYNINLPGPTGGHVEMRRIWENILPGKDGTFSALTLG